MNSKQISKIYRAICALLVIVTFEEMDNSLPMLIEIGFLPSGSPLMPIMKIAISIVKIVATWIVIYTVWIRDDE